MSQAPIIPGWYPTADGAQERWHDGQNWTGHTRPTAPQPPPAGPRQAFQQPVHANPASEQSWGPPPPPAFQPSAQQWGSGAQSPGQQFRSVSDYAHWGKRVLGTIVDGLLIVPFYIVIFVGEVANGSTTMTNEPDGTVDIQTHSSGVGTGLFIVGVLGLIGFSIWNQWIRQGRTGQTVGKKIVGIKVTREATGDVPGIGLAIGRSFAHIVDSIACYLGWLWPLWDAKNQTLGDKIANTVVVNVVK